MKKPPLSAKKVEAVHIFIPIEYIIRKGQDPKKNEEETIRIVSYLNESLKQLYGYIKISVIRFGG